MRRLALLGALLLGAAAPAPADKAAPLLDALATEHPKRHTLHRPANLEDLFLKLTGRQIREEG